MEGYDTTTMDEVDDDFSSAWEAVKVFRLRNELMVLGGRYLEEDLQNGWVFTHTHKNAVFFAFVPPLSPRHGCF